MKNRFIVIIALIAVAASVGAYYNFRNGNPKPEVRTAAITRGDIIESVGATGTLEAVTTVQVGTQVSGSIKELYADFNSIVRKGQVIARLDPSLFQTQIEQANANLVRAQADVERFRVMLDDARTKLQRAKELTAKQLIPRSELEAADVNVRSAEAQLRSAQAQVTQARASLHQNQVNLDHTVIKAPIDGIVISRNVDVGQTVAASMQAPILFLLAADLTKMKVNASIDEADVGRIRPRQRVRFRVDAFPAEEFYGEVSQVRLQPVVVQNVTTYATVIDVPNPQLKLKPGMTANVTIEIARRDDVIRVPTAALRFRPTNEIFAALNQPVPPELQRMGGRPETAASVPAGSTAGTGTAGTGAGSVAPQAGSSAPPTLLAGRDGEGAQPSQSAAPSRGFGSPGDSADPERRRRFAERLQTMSPEDRDRVMSRMRERGITPGGDRPASSAQASSGPAAPGAAAGPAGAGPQTIDSLFGPLPPTESTGRVWLYVNGQLKMVRVRLGVSDGTFTQLLDATLLQPGTELVTNVITGTEQTSGSGGGTSPLMPQPRTPGGTRPGATPGRR